MASAYAPRKLMCIGAAVLAAAVGCRSGEPLAAGPDESGVPAAEGNVLLLMRVDMPTRAVGSEIAVTWSDGGKERLTCSFAGDGTLPVAD